MAWVMLFAFFTAMDVHIEYGPIYQTQEECIAASEFENNDGTMLRTYCVPMELQ